MRTSARPFADRTAGGQIALKQTCTPIVRAGFCAYLPMPDYSEIKFSTARLHLRPLSHADAGCAVRDSRRPRRNALHDDDTLDVLDQARDLIERDLKSMPASKHLCLGIVPICEGQVVGTCTLFDIYQASRRAEAGFVLGRSAWGKDYMSEALDAVLDYGFCSMDLNRVEADTDPRNFAAANILERLGFAKEGHLRERWIMGDEKSDTALYGLLESDWKRTQ